MNKSIDSFFHEALGRWLCKFSWDYSDDVPPKQEDTALRIFSWEEYSEHCESPIEQILLAEIIFISNGYHDVEVELGPQSDGFSTIFGCQENVLEYRVDFLFTIKNGNLYRRLVVECDGHDFHDRTKEQAKRDKSRDRNLVSNGYTVLRFTGSEIYRAPEQCAEEIGNVLSMLADEINVPLKAAAE